MRVTSFCRILLPMVIAAGFVLFSAAAVLAQAPVAPVGVEVHYQLSMDGPLPKTYRVTLAIVDRNNPDWIVSQFVAGQVRTVTPENHGQFTDTWDGLDDNFMPVPPGTYGVKGIFMPASKWQVDGQYHSIVPHFVAGASSWLPTPDQWDKPEPFGGDPCGSPLADVDVGPNGVAVFYWSYLENGTNNPLFDLKKPVGYDQFLRAFPSGGAGGGTSTCTDGETVWSFSTDGGPKYVYRADGKPFGTGTAQRSHVYRPEGWVTAMAAWRDPTAGKSFVYVAERGKILEGKEWPFFSESDTAFVDKITVHEGDGGKTVAEIPVRRPRGVVARDGILYALHETEAGGFAVSKMPLQAGIPQGAWQRVMDAPAGMTPFDIEVDGHGRIYLSVPAANKVCQFDPGGKPLHTFGRLDAQQPGHYDPETFISPGKLATWTGPDGNDRLIVVEQGGPNRASEWSADGRLLREFMTLQTESNDGYAVDPDHPSEMYMPGQQGWLTRFHVDTIKHTWTVDAAWPNVGTDPLCPGLRRPRFIRINGHEYLACRLSHNVYRREGDRWLLSAGIIQEKQGNNWRYYSWHDTNGDGKVQDEEYRSRPLEMPGWLLRYHGNQWLEDLSLLALNQAGKDAWRLAPEGFDTHSNPIFTRWEKVLTDPIFEARAGGTVDAVHGGNELADSYSSDWAQADGSMADGFYINARGGPNFSANQGAQVKISRYVPDGKGGYRLLWRTGREALEGVAKPGEIYGAIHINKPINGLVSVIDNSRCGVLLYNQDGLYVESIFPDGRSFSPSVAGVYPQPGEFFSGYVYPNREDGKIYFAMGKYTPMLFEAVGWSLKDNPVHILTGVQRTVTISASNIANPPEIALTLRGGAGSAKVARFEPALGGAVLDGSMVGWESCPPVRFQADKDQSVEVRCLYDPDHLYLRWHARLPGMLDPKPLQPLDRIFTHDRLADTLSFYIQGDPRAAPDGPVGGRAGDVRMVFGVFKDGAAVRSAALGLYPSWKGADPASPLTYRTPVSRVDFAYVGPPPGVKTNWLPDEDGKGFVMTASIPRSAVPGLPLFSAGLRTMVNFEATFSGHSKFWWSNADGSASRETYDEPTEARLYPGSWAPLQLDGLEKGVLVRTWVICGPFGGPGAEKFINDPNGVLPGTDKEMKQAVKEFCDAAHYPPDDGVVDLKTAYTGDILSGYWGTPREVRWKSATTADLDTRVLLGGGGQVWYGATWISVPADTEIEFLFQGHYMTPTRFFLNGKLIQITKDIGVVKKTVTLKKGWNQVLFRAYCVGYPPARAGLILAGPPEKLWTLRLSGVPPDPG